MAKGRTIAVRITADTRGLVAGVTRAELTLGNLRKTAVAGTAVLAKFAAAGAGAAAGALTALYARTAPMIDASAKLADRLNMSTKALGGLQLQAKMSGVSAEMLTGALDRMTISIGKAVDEGGALAKSFKDIGLDLTELSGLSADEQFKKIADAIGGLKTVTAQAAAATEIFGRSGVQMLNMLREGSSAIDEAQKRAEAYGTALSRVDAAKVELANDAWENAQEAMQGMANRITVKLAPLVEALATMFSDAALDAGGFKDAIDNAFNTGIRVAGFFADVVQGLRVAFKGAELTIYSFEAVVFEVFRAAAHVAAKGFETWFSLADAAIKKINEAFGKNFATFDFKAEDAPFVKALDEMSITSIDHIRELRSEMDALAMQEMPSDKIEAFTAKVQAESQKAAEAVAASRRQMFQEGSTEETDKKLKEDFERFREGLLSKEAAEIESMARMQAEMRKFHDAGLMSNGQYWGQTAKMTVGFLTNITASVANHSKKAFDLNKKLSIAQTIMNTYEMATSAYKALAGIPIVGPALGAAAALAAIKFGQMQIQGIKSAQFGGGTAPSAQNTPAPATTPVGGGGGGGGGATAQQTVILHGIDPNALYNGSQLIDVLNLAIKDGKRLVIA